jgi:hypothetical protein
MRRLALVAVIVTCRVTVADPPVDVQKAEFSSTDPVQTAMWLARFNRPVIELRLKGNELATKAAEKALNDELRRVAGKRVDWSASLLGVKDGQVLISAHGKYPDPDTLPKNDVTEIHYVGIAPIPLRVLSEAERRFLAAAGKGTALHVQGVVAGAQFRSGEGGVGNPPRPYFTLSLELVSIRVAEKK